MATLRLLYFICLNIYRNDIFFICVLQSFTVSLLMQVSKKLNCFVFFLKNVTKVNQITLHTSYSRQIRQRSISFIEQSKAWNAMIKRLRDVLIEETSIVNILQKVFNNFSPTSVCNTVYCIKRHNYPLKISSLNQLYIVFVPLMNFSKELVRIRLFNLFKCLPF